MTLIFKGAYTHRVHEDPVDWTLPRVGFSTDCGMPVSFFALHRVRTVSDPEAAETIDCPRCVVADSAFRQHA